MLLIILSVISCICGKSSCTNNNHPTKNTLEYMQCNKLHRLNTKKPFFLLLVPPVGNLCRIIYQFHNMNIFKRVYLEFLCSAVYLLVIWLLVTDYWFLVLLYPFIILRKMLRFCLKTRKPSVLL